MAVQTQTETSRVNPIEEEEETVASRKTRKAAKKKPAKPMRPWQVVLGIVGCAAALFLGRYLRYDTTLFMEHRTLNGYLPVEEYMLNYSDTKEPTQNVRSFHLDRYSVYDVNSGYETSRGIRIGDSWDSFVEAYGDMTMDYAYTTRYREDGSIDWDYDSPYFRGTYTVREFDEKFVKTGEIDPVKDGIEVDFRVETDGMKIFYSNDEQNNYYHSYTNSHLSYPNTRDIYLDFTFAPESDTGRPGLTLKYISQSSYR